MGTNSDFETGLRTLFTRVFGDSQALETFKRLSGGASQETWALSNAQHSAILRRAPGGTSMARSSAAIGLPAEAKLIDAAGRAGVPVPKVLHVLAPDDGLGDGFLMSRVLGETIARPILRNDEFASARSVLAAQCGNALADIHSIALEGLPEELQASGGLAQTNGIRNVHQWNYITLIVVNFYFKVKKHRAIKLRCLHSFRELSPWWRSSPHSHQATTYR